MNTEISKPFIALENRLFSLHFSEPEAPDRSEVEQFIGAIFFQAYGAKIRRFKPCLMSLRDQQHKLVAACGFRGAALETLFLENYLDQPIEALLSRHTGLEVKRSEIVGVGNFSVAEPGMARYLIAAINDHLHDTSNQWAVCTVVPVLRNAFVKMNLKPIILGDADKSRLHVEERIEWGSYYAQKPQVLAIQRIERQGRPQNSVEEMLAAQARCQSCGLMAKK